MTVSVKVQAGIATIQFERPNKRNALDAETYTRLGAELLELESSDVGAVIITGGEDYFSAGVDIEALDGFAGDPDAFATWLDISGDAYRAIQRHPHPVIAACAGPTLGGGLDVALFSDVRIASRSATFGFPQVRFGLTPFFDALQRAVGESQAKRLSFTGQVIDADEALRIGLIDVLVPDGESVAKAREMAEDMIVVGAVTTARIKQMSVVSRELGAGAALDYEMQVYRDVSVDPETMTRIGEVRRRLTTGR